MDDPGDAAARAHLDGEHRPAASLRDEVLLQVLADAALAHELLEPVGDALPPGAQLAAELAQLRRGVVLEVGAVLLDGAVDRGGERFQRGVDRGRELAQQRRLLLLESSPRPQRPGDGVADVPKRRGGKDTAELRVRRRVADVPDPLERRLRRDVEQRDHLGGERLAARHFGRVRRRRQRTGQRSSAGRWQPRRRPAAGSRGTRARREPAVPPPECRPDMVERHALAPPDHGRRLSRRWRGGKRGRRWRAASSRCDGLRADAGAAP